MARKDDPGGLLNKIKMSCYANIDANEIFMLRLIIWCLLHEIFNSVLCGLSDIYQLKPAAINPNMPNEYISQSFRFNPPIS